MEMKMKMRDETNKLGHSENQPSASSEAPYFSKKLAHYKKSKKTMVMAHALRSKADIMQRWIRNRKLAGHLFHFTVSLKLLLI